MEKEELWQAVLAKIELNLSRPNFLTWFQGTGIMEIRDGIVTVCVPNGFAREWLQNKYHKPVLHTLRELNSHVREVSYVIGKLPSNASPAVKEPVVLRKKRPEPDAQDLEEYGMRDLTVDPETNLNPRYTFDSFVVGSFNELSHAAAQSVIKNPGTTYNPLFIYGGVGLGKTHLIQAVGNELLRQNRGLRVCYIWGRWWMR